MARCLSPLGVALLRTELELRAGKGERENRGSSLLGLLFQKHDTGTAIVAEI